jgi:hypothetical protein
MTNPKLLPAGSYPVIAAYEGSADFKAPVSVKETVTVTG